MNDVVEARRRIFTCGARIRDRVAEAKAMADTKINNLEYMNYFTIAACVLRWSLRVMKKRGKMAEIFLFEEQPVDRE